MSTSRLLPRYVVDDLLDRLRRNPALMAELVRFNALLKEQLALMEIHRPTLCGVGAVSTEPVSREEEAGCTEDSSATDFHLPYDLT